MAALSVGVITNDSHTYTERMTMDLTDKIAAYANALDGYAFDTKAEALENARTMREQCREIRRNTNDERNAL
jgi:hypothetical protein